MAQLIEITRVAVAPKYFMARVVIAPGGPLTTDQDLMGTTHIYNLLPEICDHTCLGDTGSTFKEAMGATEIAHLLEHVAIELMARTGIAGDISCGRTFTVEDEPRTYDIQLACPDDVLVSAALSSAAWILQWAYSGAEDPKPDIEAIVSGIRQLTLSACAADGTGEGSVAAAAEAELAAKEEAANDASGSDEPETPVAIHVGPASFEVAEPAVDAEADSADQD